MIRSQDGGFADTSVGDFADTNAGDNDRWAATGAVSDERGGDCSSGHVIVE